MTGGCERSSFALPRPVPLSVNIGSSVSTESQSIVYPVGTSNAGIVTSMYVRPFTVLMSTPEPPIGETIVPVGPAIVTAAVVAGDAFPSESFQAPSTKAIETVAGDQAVAFNM